MRPYSALESFPEGQQEGLFPQWWLQGPTCRYGGKIHLSSSYDKRKSLVAVSEKWFILVYIHVLLLFLVPLLLLKAKHDISSPSDLSSDNSDLAMLKSLLAGLSLPSKSGVLDRGSDEEKDGESEWGECYSSWTCNMFWSTDAFMRCMLCLFFSYQPNERVFRVENVTCILIQFGTGIWDGSVVWLLEQENSS